MDDRSGKRSGCHISAQPPSSVDCSLRLLEFVLSTVHPRLAIFSLQSLVSESRNIVNRFCLMCSTIVSNWFGLSDFLGMASSGMKTTSQRNNEKQAWLRRERIKYSEITISIQLNDMQHHVLDPFCVSLIRSRSSRHVHAVGFFTEPSVQARTDKNTCDSHSLHLFESNVDRWGIRASSTNTEANGYPAHMVRRGIRESVKS